MLAAGEDEHHAFVYALHWRFSLKEPVSTCPACGCGPIVAVLYGLFTSLDPRHVYGGCCVDRYSPKWECLGCGNRFGGMDPKVEPREAFDPLNADEYRKP